jgi:type I restriction enzyme S subunit
MRNYDNLNLPEGWEMKKLGDVIKLEYGKPLPDENRVANGKYPFYGANGEKGRTNQFYYDKKSIIVGRKGSAGEINLTEDKFWPLDVSYFVTFDEKQSDLLFLFHLLSSLELPNLAKGVKPGINRNEVYEIDVALPPLAEQQRIVSILDASFAAIAQAKTHAEQNLNNVKELFENYLQSVFENKGADWETKMLKEIGIAQTGTTPKTADKENYGNFISFIKPSDIDIMGNGEIRYDNEGLSEQGLKTGRKMLKGSILMVCIGATIGKVGFADRTVSCNQQINSLTVHEKFYPKFIYYALRTESFFQQVIMNAAQATLPIINKGKWEALKISFPKSKTEQQTIVAKLDALSAATEKLTSVYRAKVSALGDLKKAVLEKAFSGGLK